MQKYKVLIIEDELIIAMHLQEILEQDGYDVVGIINKGEDVLEEYEELNPDVLLVDIMLADKMTGIDAVRQLKEKHTPCIIFLTSNSNASMIDEAKKTNPEAFLKKPFEDEQLKATIEFALHSYLENQTYLEKQEKQNQMAQMQINELMETQQHLVTATWRERELKDELQKSKVLIETQNKKILDSINYAHRIQKAIIPDDIELKEHLGDYFMFYKPKDVVSGDFPWLFIRDEYVYIAAVDCTGHGVPGAMMSLIGHLLLNDIANDREIKTPGEILNELHKAVVKTLKQDAPGNKAADGMDIAMCRIHKSTNEVVYSGAHRPLYKLTNGEIVQYKGCKYPIGGMQYNGENHFNDHTVKIHPGDSIYFFSDGLPDQFGGPENLKIGPKRIRNTIIENEGAPMESMKAIFDSLFHNWMGVQKQMDDVLLIGIHF